MIRTTKTTYCPKNVKILEAFFKRESQSLKNTSF